MRVSQDASPLTDWKVATDKVLTFRIVSTWQSEDGFTIVIGFGSPLSGNVIGEVKQSGRLQHRDRMFPSVMGFPSIPELVVEPKRGVVHMQHTRTLVALLWCKERARKGSPIS